MTKIKDITPKVKRLKLTMPCKLGTCPGQVIADGPVDAEVMLLGEQPGRLEIEQGHIFIGPESQQLNKLLELAGIKRETLLISNIVRCRLENGRKSTPKERNFCAAFAKQMIEDVKPRLIVLMGSFATQTILGQKVNKVRGLDLIRGGHRYYSVYHPAVVLHDPNKLKILEQDFVRLGHLLTTVRVAPTISTEIITANQLISLLPNIRNTDKPPFRLALDTEFTEDGKIVGMGLSWQPLKAYYLPFEESIKAANYLGESNVSITYHNAKEDMKILWKNGASGKGLYKNSDDTMVMAHLCNEESLGLKPLSNKFLHRDLHPFHEMFPDGNIAAADVKEVGPYCGADAEATFCLKSVLRAKLEAQNSHRVYDFCDREFTYIIAQMEYMGVKLDYDYLSEVAPTMKAEVDKEHAELSNIINGNINSTQQLAKYLFDDLKLHNMHKRSTEKDVLLKLNTELTNRILAYRKVKKQYSTYVEGYLESKSPRIHTSFQQVWVETGRLCLAKGTYIDTARNLETYPKGVPIEEVKVGDWAYTYSNDLKLTLNRVKWVGKTGHKRVVRINWIGSGHRFRGSLDVTPDHKVRLTSGEYIEAQYLNVNDHVLALSRDIGSYGYARLYITGVTEAQRENRVIASRFSSIENKHVHHMNRNKLDNTPSNLAAMSVNEHLSFESRTRPLKSRIQAAETLHKQYLNGERFPIRRYGADNPCYLGLNKDWMLAVLWENYGKPTAFRDKYGIDYKTVQKYMAIHDIDFKEIRKFFNARDEFLSAELVVKATTIGKEQSQEAAQKFIGLGYYKFRGIQEFYKLIPFNHQITSIEWLDSEVDVYDLEVEDTHNLIANGICVSNSSKSPNLQNVPESVRGAFCADNGFTWIGVDASQLELRDMAHITEDPLMLEMFLKGEDFHLQTARLMFGQMAGAKERKIGKLINFLVSYSGGPPALVAAAFRNHMVVTMAEADYFIKLYYQKFKRLREYKEASVEDAIAKGYVRTPLGRLRYLPSLSSSNPKEREHGEKEVFSTIVQGNSAEIIKIATNATIDIPNKTYALHIHDELIAQVPKLLALEMCNILSSTMTNSVKLKVPLIMDVAEGNNWARMHAPLEADISLEEVV